MEGLENELWRRWSEGKVGEWAELIDRDVQQSSFSNLTVTSPTSQLILQPFRHFTYVTAHSPTLPSLYLRHRSFSNPFVASPTSQHILQAFHRFTYVTAHSPTLPLLYLRHSSFSNPSVASPTSQFVLQPFFRFSYVTSSSLNSPGEPPMLTVEGKEPDKPQAGTSPDRDWNPGPLDERQWRFSSMQDCL